MSPRHPGSSRMFQPGQLTLGVFFPIEAFAAEGRVPGATAKPFGQSLYIDLAREPDARPVPIHLEKEIETCHS